MRKSWSYGTLAVLLFITTIGVMQGCNKHKTLVAAHNTVGALLISTVDEAKSLHEQNIINDDTYNQIKTNWLRAQNSYVNASIILEGILDAKPTDLSEYLSLITQVNTILSDIALWIKEDK